MAEGCEDINSGAAIIVEVFSRCISPAVCKVAPFIPATTQIEQCRQQRLAEPECWDFCDGQV